MNNIKKILLIGIIFFICGCSFFDNDKKVMPIDNSDLDKNEYKDDNPIKLGIFLVDNNYHNKSVIKDTYYTDFVSGKDIASFEVFYTGDEVIDGTNFKNTWNNYYDKYTDIGNYKIGYNIKFILNDGTSLDNTLMTSIKIYAVDGIDDVKDIILTAFTYDDEDDFDDNGNYRGSSSYTIEIKRK